MALESWRKLFLLKWLAKKGGRWKRSSSELSYRVTECLRDTRSDPGLEKGVLQERPSREDGHEERLPVGKGLPAG